MKKRLFGKSGSQVSEIGLGTWQLGSHDWGPVNEATSQEILSVAVDQGMNFFDTADIYGLGLSEERIGKFLKTTKEKIFIASKFGRFPQPGWPKNYRLFNFRQFIEASLKRLGVETIDLMQLHCIPFEYLQKPELYEWLEILKKEGKVKNFGASVENAQEALFCLDKEIFASVQIIFNIYRQAPIDMLFDKAREKHVAIIVRLPLASGLLSGKFTPQSQFVKEDHRNYNKDGERFNVGETFSGIPFAQGLALTEELKEILPAGMTMAQMALRFILDFDAVSVVIPGATRLEQVMENASASELPPLPDTVHAQLRKFFDERVVACIRGKQ